MKTCPACAEEIQDLAKKCKHCGEWLENESDDVAAPASTPVKKKSSGPACGTRGTGNRRMVA